MTLQILSCPSPASAPKRPKARLRSERHGRDSLPRGRGQQPLLLSVSPFHLLLLGSSSSLTFAGLLFFFWLTLLSTIFARFSNFLTFQLNRCSSLFSFLFITFKALSFIFLFSPFINIYSSHTHSLFIVKVFSIFLSILFSFYRSSISFPFLFLRHPIFSPYFFPRPLIPPPHFPFYQLSHFPIRQGRRERRREASHPPHVAEIFLFFSKFPLFQRVKTSLLSSNDLFFSTFRPFLSCFSTLVFP